MANSTHPEVQITLPLDCARWTGTVNARVLTLGSQSGQRVLTVTEVEWERGKGDP